MPTVILLDVSLSMSRRIAGADGRKTETQILHIAQNGIHYFLDELADKSKLEFTSLVIFSSLWEIVVPFTRDFAALKAGCFSIDVYDKTRIENALQGVESLVMEEWGGVVPINIILVTDGRVGVGSGSLKDSLKKAKVDEGEFPLPFSFPSNLSIVCLDEPGIDENFAENMNCYRDLIKLNNGNGEIYTPEGPLSNASVEQLFQKIIKTHYQVYTGTLFCGNLSSKITLLPFPNFKNSWLSILCSYRPEKKNITNINMPTELPIAGFLDIADISNPPYISRHVVLPIPKTTKGADGSKAQQSTEEDAKSPSFCVLLHGSLKIEKMVAVVQLGPSWFGILHSWSDNRKKSTLMLSIFEPHATISWLGNLRGLGPSAEFSPNPYQYDQTEDAEETPFPITPSRRRSYHLQPNVVWIKNAGLQSDVQKVLRYAKKLPEKQSAFYKELNRIRRAALSYSFNQLIFHVADLLDKEASNLSSDAARHLINAASELRLAPKRSLTRNIGPLEGN